ncbi:MAG: VUT family protein [Coriobacteriales bacterium]|jgi:hypothetical protein|nr:VUT family protein [Coriobacteriales bacterium]
MKKLFSEFFRLLDSLPSLVLSLLVLSVVAMNLLANKSINTGLSWLALDCGILFSWLTFLTMDIMTHCYGPRAATAGSLFAMVLNLFMAAMFFLAKMIPGVWGESFVVGSEAVINTALDNTFGGTWFILLGSSIAFAVSAVLNNYLNWGIGEQVNGNGFGIFALRSYVSTFLAQFTDNITFALIVSRTFFGWTLLQCFTCALTGAIMELLFEVFFSPVGYRISRAILDERAAAATALSESC